jgi:isoquinoline 1-oxidoreductase subunit beta
MHRDHPAVRAVGSPPANSLSRRRFLQTGAAAGGGLMLGLHLPFANDAAKATGAGGFAPNAFIRIGSDGQIVLTMPYVEMGQGTYTSIPMLIAEELEVDLEQVQLEHAPPNEKLYANPLLGVQATGNSNAIRGAWKPLRQAGATARTMLVAAAAARWNVDPASCRAQSGEVLHPLTGRRLAYGAVSADAAHMPSRPTLSLRNRRISNSSARRPDGWTRRSRSTAPPSTASTFGRRASRSRPWRNRRWSAGA